jgi:hypothetical protein
MDDTVPLGSAAYFGYLALLLLARGSDILSTWVATPRLILEANPVAKKLGWKWGIPANALFCLVLALWPLPAIIIATTSVMIAARNFQSAWVMRTLGEESYRLWHRERLEEGGLRLFVFCLFAQAVLTAAVGVALICLSPVTAVAAAIGWGILAYTIAVVFYTLFSLWRRRRSLG